MVERGFLAWLRPAQWVQGYPLGRTLVLSWFCPFVVMSLLVVAALGQAFWLARQDNVPERLWQRLLGPSWLGAIGVAAACLLPPRGPGKCHLLGRPQLFMNGKDAMIAVNDTQSEQQTLITAGKMQSRSRADQRLVDRRDYGRIGTLRFDSEFANVVVQDLSREGCHIETDAVLTREAAISIGLPGVGIVDARVVWRDSDGYGCVFRQPLKPGAITSAFSNNVAPFILDLSTPLAHKAADHAVLAKLPILRSFWIVTASAIALWMLIISLAAAIYHFIG